MARWAFLTALTASSAALAGPLLPNILGHTFTFDGFNSGGTAPPFEYQTNGTQPDTLIYQRHSGDREVLVYHPDWPAPPPYPVWDEVSGVGTFGGDFVLAVQFTGQDGPVGSLDVSLTGTGLNTSPGAADLMIYGTLVVGANTWRGLLLALDLTNVVLYGRSNNPERTYVVEGVGTIVGGLVAEANSLVGAPGAMRGHLSFQSPPAGWMPPLYDPLSASPVSAVRAGYAGDTGVIPEPATLVLTALGVVLVTRRR